MVKNGGGPQKLGTTSRWRGWVKKRDTLKKAFKKGKVMCLWFDQLKAKEKEKEALLHTAE